MNTKPIADYNKSLPTANGTENGVMVKNANGVQYSKPIAEFGCVMKVTANVGQVVRIRNVSSAFISARGLAGDRCSLIWVSGYAPGTSIRFRACKVFDASNYYDWYVNGSSEADAIIYLRLIGTSGYDEVSVCSLFGELPKVETVSSVPSDATPLVFATS